MLICGPGPEERKDLQHLDQGPQAKSARQKGPESPE